MLFFWFNFFLFLVDATHSGFITDCSVAYFYTFLNHLTVHCTDKVFSATQRTSRRHEIWFRQISCRCDKRQNNFAYLNCLPNGV